MRDFILKFTDLADTLPRSCEGDSVSSTKLERAGHLDVLNAIPEEYRESVLQQCTQKRYPKGQTLWRQGDAAGYVAFLATGKAISTFHSSNGKTGVTGYWFAGDLLGCADLSTSRKRQMTVRFLADSSIYMLSAQRFFAISDRFPEVAHTIIRALATRLSWVANLALILQTQNAPERVASVLLALAEGFGRQCGEGVVLDLNITHEDLAGMVGVSRQFATTTLHALEDKGLITTGQRKITLTDTANLRKLSGLYANI